MWTGQYPKKDSTALDSWICLWRFYSLHQPFHFAPWKSDHGINSESAFGLSFSNTCFPNHPTNKFVNLEFNLVKLAWESKKRNDRERRHGMCLILTSSTSKGIPPRKFTCPLTRYHFRRKFHLPTINFQGRC